MVHDAAVLETTLLPVHPLIESVLGSFRLQLGRDFAAYRGHVYRVFHYCRALVGGEAHQAIAVAAVFHDIGIWADDTFDYLEPSRARARAFLAAQPVAPAAEVESMIDLHHKLTRCPPGAGELVEAFRRADLVDLSCGCIRFGLPRAFVRGVREVFPNAGFHAAIGRIGFCWLLRHPWRPLPMMKW